MHTLLEPIIAMCGKQIAAFDCVKGCGEADTIKSDSVPHFTCEHFKDVALLSSKSNQDSV